MMMPTSNRMVAVLISKNEITTSGVGRIRVRPVSTTKVRKVDSRARPTANGARKLLRGPPLDSANVGSSDGAEVSALVIPAKGKRVAEGLPLAGLYRQQTDAFISQCCQIATIPRRLLPLRLTVPDSLYGLIGGWAAKAPASFPDFDLFGARKPVSPIKCQEGVSGIRAASRRSGKLGCPDRESSSVTCCGSVRANRRRGFDCPGWPPAPRSARVLRSPGGSGDRGPAAAHHSENPRNAMTDRLR